MSSDVHQPDNLAEATIKSINEFALPATPNIYAVWYSYHGGERLDLVRAIDLLISNNREIDERLIEEIHQQYLEHGKEAEFVRDAGAQLELVVNNAIGRMQTATEDAGAFGNALESFNEELDLEDEDSIRGLITSILSDTRKIETQNLKLQDELNSYSNEVTKLREDLEFVRQEARTDALTGLANRKYFDTFINDATRDAVENGTDLSLLIADVDHFKSFNDTYGHQLGDQVLKIVSRVLQENSKGRDLAARYGGKEFCVVLPNTGLDNARILADQMREIVSAKKIVKKRTGEELRQITMSVGVAQFEYGEPVSELINRADEALYRAMQNGRNRVSSQHDLVASAMAVSD